MSTTRPATDSLAIARALICCPSVTPDEAGALDYLTGLLGDAGFVCHRLRFADRNTPDVDNLYARIGNSAPHLMFAGHVDVVPVGDAAAWTHGPFEAAIENGRLYGRGAVDMKGGVAAFAAAALDYLGTSGSPNGSISLLLTGDEEGPAVNGTIKMLRWAAEHGERFDHAIVGEPTNPQALGDMIKIGRRGSVTGMLSVNGKQGHVAYPHLAENPIPGLVRLIGALSNEALDGGTANFQPSNLEFTTIDVGNTATNVIPARASARFNIRHNDLWTAQSLEVWLRERLDAAARANDRAIRYALDIDPAISDVFLTKPGAFTDLVCAAVKTVTGRMPELSTSGGTSDARFIKDYCPVVEFGLVGQTMHQVDENIAIGDLETLTQIYRRILETYFVGT